MELQSEHRKKTAKLLQLHELTLEILESCRSSLDVIVKLLHEKPLKNNHILQNTNKIIKWNHF